VKSNLAPLTACVMLVGLFGCASDCTQTVHVGDPDTVVTYTDSNGTTYQATTDANGNVAVPCSPDGQPIIAPVGSGV
jgi:hypothetical protein